MTTPTPSLPDKSNVSMEQRMGTLPGLRTFKNLPIGRKLIIGFGILVLLTLLVAGISWQSSREANILIDKTEQVRAPITLEATNAQTNLLKMLASVRGYLALGNAQFIDDYYQSEALFEQNLTELRTRLEEANAVEEDPLTYFRLERLEEAFEAWRPLPQQLFDLRDDRLEREPAYKILATDGTRYGGQVLLDSQKMLESQALRDASANNLELLEDIANFQSSFAAMFSGLRNYVTTQNRIFRQEYEANLTANEFAWERLLDKQDRGLLTDNQKEFMISIGQSRDDFLLLPDNQIFPILESERRRADLFLFADEAVPLNETMLSLLDDMTIEQQASLKSELNQGRVSLNNAVSQILTFGGIAAVLGMIMSFGFRSLIASPIRRLTAVAEQIRRGDLGAQAQVESADETGTLASTFNRMTTQLRDTLLQVRREKKRADDLLNVVIPIGVDLSSEKDFNRLLEKMLVEAKTFCKANTGILYLRTEDNQLQYVIVRDDSHNFNMGGTSGVKVPYDPIPMYLDKDEKEPNQANIAVATALHAETINISNSRVEEAYQFASPDGQEEYFATAYLNIPLLNSQEEVIGVMQLSDPTDPETKTIEPFDLNLQQMMESFSSLAVAALEAYRREQALRQEIQQLRIEIDATKKEQQVEEIVETDFFRDLQAKARQLRERRK